MNCYTVAFICRFSERPTLAVRCRAMSRQEAFSKAVNKVCRKKHFAGWYIDDEDFQLGDFYRYIDFNVKSFDESSCGRRYEIYRGYQNCFLKSEYL